MTPRLCVLVLPALGIAPGIYEPLLAGLRDSPSTHAEVVPLPGGNGSVRALWAARSEGYGAWLQAIERRIAALRQQSADCKVVLLGHSLGGHVGLLALAGQLPIDGLALVASGTPYWGAWPTPEQRRMRRGLRIVSIALRLCPWYPGDWLGFGGRQPRQLMRDWLALAQTGRFDRIAGLPGVEQRLHRVQGTVLSVGIEGDPLAPPAATQHLLVQAPALQVQPAMATSERLQQQSPARRHNLWPRYPQAVLPILLPWLRAVQLQGAQQAGGV